MSKYTGEVERVIREDGAVARVTVNVYGDLPRPMVGKRAFTAVIQAAERAVGYDLAKTLQWEEVLWGTCVNNGKERYEVTFIPKS